MSEPQNTDSGQPPQTTESTSSAGTQNTENMIPQSRLTEVVQERNDLQKRLVALETAQQERTNTELAEQNRFKELAEQLQKRLDELQAIEATATRYSTALQASNEIRLQQIPDDKRSIVPEYDDPVQLGKWFDDNLDKLTDPGKPSPPKLDGGSGSGGSSSDKPLSAKHQDVADLARRYGYSVDNERIAQYALQKPEQKPNEKGE